MWVSQRRLCNFPIISSLTVPRKVRKNFVRAWINTDLNCIMFSELFTSCNHVFYSIKIIFIIIKYFHVNELFIAQIFTRYKRVFTIKFTLWSRISLRRFFLKLRQFRLLSFLKISYYLSNIKSGSEARWDRREP